MTDDALVSELRRQLAEAIRAGNAWNVAVARARLKRATTDREIR